MDRIYSMNRSPLFVLVFALASGGCSGPTPSSQLEAQPPTGILPQAESVGWRGATRLAPLLFNQRRAAQVEPLDIPLSRIQAVDGGELAIEDGQCVARSSNGGIVLTVTSAIDATCYTTLDLSLTTDADTLGVIVPALPGDVKVNTLQAPMKRSSTPQTYSFALPRSVRHGMWDGFIIHLPGVKSARITRVTFRYVAPRAPERITLDSVTHEVVRGTQPPWRLEVPEAAVFSAHVAFAPDDSRVNSVRFRVVATTADGAVTEVVTRDLSTQRSWRRVQCPLDAFAGQTIELGLEVDAAGPAESTHALWGSPMVVEADRDRETTPVILISLDTLRADHLGCYGYIRDTSPVLDGFARGAVRFENAIVFEPWTLTSHMTMLTGLHHERHGINHTQNLPESVVTLAERLRDAGYVAGAVVGHGYWLDPMRGFHQGFDYYHIPQAVGFEDVDTTLGKTLEWLSAQTTDRLFLFFHTYEIHSKFEASGYMYPYQPSDESFLHFTHDYEATFPTGDGAPVATEFLFAANLGDVDVTEAQRDHMIAGYDDSIRLVDRALGSLFHALDERGLYDKSLIIITSDHGEEFGERDRYLHTSIYEDCIRVPLLVKFPNGRFGGSVNDKLVTNADLAPTVLDVLGLPAATDANGLSLVPMIRDEAPGHAQAQLTHRHTEDGLRTASWKFIHHFRENRYELYHLESDPNERVNRYDEAPEILAELESELASRLQLRPGWHLAFSGGAKRAGVSVRVESASPFERCLLRRAEDAGIDRDELETSRDKTRATATVQLYPGDVDELFLRNDGQPLTVRIVSLDGAPMVVRQGASDPVPTRQYNAVLDPADDRLHDVPPKRTSEAITVRVWHVPTPPDTEPSRALTHEELEQIESLGYLAP